MDEVNTAKNEIERLLVRYSKRGEKDKVAERFKKLAEALLVPDETIKYIHVAGTNGKGSVCEFITTALIRDAELSAVVENDDELKLGKGAKIGKFTSPYLTEINERICIDNVPVDYEELLHVFRKADYAAEEIGQEKFSQFEILTAAALLCFKDNEVEYAVIETGIGGLFDCTNIITPVVGVITKVSVDHTDILGSELSEIARHKAGIIKPNVPVVTDPRQSDEVMEVIREIAEQNSSKLVVPDLNLLKIFETSISGSEMQYKHHSLRINMGGEYQIYNAITAEEALSIIGIKPAFLDARVPARLQIITENPFIIVDGAHNPDGFASAKDAFIKAIETEEITGEKIIVTGMLSSKDYKAGLKSLIFPGATVVLTDGFAPDAVSTRELKQICRDLGAKKIYSVHMASGAIDLAWYLAGLDGIILICGSLYLAGEALRHFKKDIGYTGI